MKRAICFAVVLLALQVVSGQDGPVTLSYRFDPGETLIYQLEEARTDRGEASSNITTAASILRITVPEEQNRTAQLTIDKHRVARKVTALEGASADFSVPNISPKGIASLLAPYFPPLPERPLAAGDSWTAPFVPPSLGRVTILDDAPVVSYTIVQVTRARSRPIAEIAATAELDIANAALQVSRLGIGRPRSTAVRVSPGTTAYEAGLRTGDRIVKVRGKPVATWEEVASIPSTGRLSVEIVPPLREEVGGKTVKRDSHYVFVIPEGAGVETVGISPLGLPVADSHDVVVGSVQIGSPADKGGIIPGDTVIRLGAARAGSWTELEQLLSAVPPGTRIQIHRIPPGERKPVTSSVVTGAKELYRFSAKGTFAGSFRIDVESGTLLEASWECKDLLLIPSISNEDFEIRTSLKNTLSLIDRRTRRQ